MRKSQWECRFLTEKMFSSKIVFALFLLTSTVAAQGYSIDDDLLLLTDNDHLGLHRDPDQLAQMQEMVNLKIILIYYLSTNTCHAPVDACVFHITLRFGSTYVHLHRNLKKQFMYFQNAMPFIKSMHK